MEEYLAKKYNISEDLLHCFNYIDERCVDKDHVLNQFPNGMHYLKECLKYSFSSHGIFKRIHFILNSLNNDKVEKTFEKYENSDVLKLIVYCIEGISSKTCSFNYYFLSKSISRMCNIFSDDKVESAVKSLGPKYNFIIRNVYYNLNKRVAFSLSDFVNNIYEIDVVKKPFNELFVPFRSKLVWKYLRVLNNVKVYNCLNSLDPGFLSEKSKDLVEIVKNSSSSKDFLKEFDNLSGKL